MNLFFNPNFELHPGAPASTGAHLPPGDDSMAEPTGEGGPASFLRTLVQEIAAQSSRQQTETAQDQEVDDQTEDSPAGWVAALSLSVLEPALPPYGEMGLEPVVEEVETVLKTGGISGTFDAAESSASGIDSKPSESTGAIETAGNTLRQAAVQSTTIESAPLPETAPEEKQAADPGRATPTSHPAPVSIQAPAGSPEADGMGGRLPADLQAQTGNQPAAPGPEGGHPKIDPDAGDPKIGPDAGDPKIGPDAGDPKSGLETAGIHSDPAGRKIGPAEADLQDQVRHSANHGGEAPGSNAGQEGIEDDAAPGKDKDDRGNASTPGASKLLDVQGQSRPAFLQEMEREGTDRGNESGDAARHHAVKAAAALNEAEASQDIQRERRIENLNEIVKSAVFRFKEGHSEVKLHLQPESLGNVRLQVAMENQQVHLKVIAEYHAVKELIENSISQLKADLQAHGLEIDEVEVFVAGEEKDLRNESRHSGRFAFQGGNRGRADRLENVPAAAVGVQPPHAGRGRDGIDMFA